jgi:hypothetical protein
MRDRASASFYLVFREQLPRFRVPEMHAPVLGARGNQTSVRRHRNPSHRRRVTLEHTKVGNIVMQ